MSSSRPGTATVEEGRRIAADPALTEDWRRSVIDTVNGHDARETAVNAAEPWLGAPNESNDGDDTVKLEDDLSTEVNSN